jgi:CBS domain containing-hemolysin-like protein
MLAGVLSVETRMVREIMTPRRRLVTVRDVVRVDESLTMLAGTAHTRFPVTDEDDDVTGIVHLRDLFVQAQTRPASLVSELARPVLTVAEVLTVPKLWRTLRDAEQHCAIVANEYGSVVGMITLEDAIEEIFGEVHDEFDLEEEPINVVGDRVSVRGDVLLEMLSDRFDLQVFSDEVDTVGGLVWQLLGRVPEVGDEVRLEPDGIVVRVDAVDGRAVARVGFILPSGAR